VLVPTVFTQENRFYPARHKPISLDNIELVNDIILTEDMVMRKLDLLREDKAGGSNDLSPRLLRNIKSEICTPLTVIFHEQAQ